MTVLFLAHRIPFPPNKGDKIRSFHMLERIRRRHDVSVAALIDDFHDLDVVPQLRARVRDLAVARIDQPGRRIASLSALVSGGAISVRHFYSTKLQRTIDAILDEVSLEAVFCSCSPMAEYLFRSRHWTGKLESVPKVMDLIDVDSYKWQQYAERGKPWSSWIYRRESLRLRDYEARIGRTFDRLLLVSEQEAEYFPDSESRAKLLAVTNGVDLDFFAPQPRVVQRGVEPTVVFTGVMNYWPNVEGMRWFIGEVLPLLRDAIPTVRVLIVGSKPVAEVRGWGQLPGVTVTGFVPDVREFLAAADVCIAPLRVARGIQNKVLEAMAMGKPVVATPEAFEGVAGARGRDVMVAKGATSFAQAVIALLRSPEEAVRMGASARQCVEAKYSWEENLRILDSLIPGGHS